MPDVQTDRFPDSFMGDHEKQPINKLNTIPRQEQIIIGMVIGTGAFLPAALLPDVHFLTSLVLIIAAVGLYFYFALCVDGGNPLSLKGIFSGMWLGTIGLANMKLLGYQVTWEKETWLLVSMTYAVFLLGFMILDAVYPSGSHIKQKLSFLKIDENRLFTICLVTGLIGMIAFIINICIKGFVPFFVTDNEMAYYDFYTRFYVFTVASTACSGICYYTAKTQNLVKWKKLLLYGIIIYEVIVMPTLSVSRGTQMIAILSLTVSIVKLTRHNKFPVFFCCMIFAFTMYEAGSAARHLSNDYLNYVFQPREIQVSVSDSASADASEILSSTETAAVSGTSDSETTPSATAASETNATESTVSESTVSENTVSENTVAVESAEATAEVSSAQTIVLPAKVAFLYGYLTSAHDNLNEAVNKYTHHDLGLRQLQAFTSVLRFPSLVQKIRSLPFYQVSGGLNTGDLITDAYYDFGGIGSLIFILIWSMIFAATERLGEDFPNAFSMVWLGCILIPITLCFFESWLSYFTFWLMLGTNLLMFLASARRQGKKKSLPKETASETASETVPQPAIKTAVLKKKRKQFKNIIIIFTVITFFTVGCELGLNFYTGWKTQTIKIDAESMTMHPGDEMQLSAFTYPKYCRKNVVWNSSNPEIASVGADGRITALQYGDTVIYANVDDQTAEYRIRVVPDHNTIYENTDYALVYNYEYYVQNHQEFWNDPDAALADYVQNGIPAGEQACEEFDPVAYADFYKDVQNAFGEDYNQIVMHYIDTGYEEGRNGLGESELSSK